MAVTATSAQSIIIGAGSLFYKDDNGIWTPAGATVGDDLFSVVRTYYAPVINGIRGKLKGTDYVKDETAKLEVQMAETRAALLALLIPDVAETGGTVPGLVGSGATGTLSDAILPDQSAAIKLSSVTSLTVGDFLKVGPSAAGYTEFRKVTRVGTLGMGGTGVDVDFPFAYAHASGEDFVEVDGDGSSLITSGPNRRLPSSAYRDFALYVQGLDGRDVRFLIYNGIATGPAEFTASDSKESAPKIIIEGRIDGATPYVQPWDIVLVPTYLQS